MRTILLFTLAISICTPVFGQTDSALIAGAKNAVIIGSCDDALTLLSRVSDVGKVSANYLLYEGKAHDCKGDDEQAISCYEKYLALMPSDEQIKKRKTDLAYNLSKKKSAASDQVAVKMMYNNATKGRAAKRKKGRSNRKNIYDDYVSIGIGCDAALGGANAPYKSGIGFTIDNGFPIINSHLVLNYCINSDFLFAPNKTWYGNAFSVSASDVNGVGLGYEDAITFGVMPVLINNNRLALTVGPSIGIKMTDVPDITSSNYDYSFSNGTGFYLCYGLKADLFIRRDLLIFAEYSKTACNSITASSPFGDVSVPVNYDILRLGISVRSSNWWFW